MKSSPKKEQKNKCLKDLAFTNYLFNTKFKAAFLVVCLSGVGTFLAGDIPRLKDKILASVSPHTLSTEVDQVAAEITIKILGKDFLGSGFLLKKEDQKYIVITNQHVLRAGKAPFTIQAPDGEAYPAKVLAHLNSTKYDLAILEFEAAEKDYQVATVGNSVYLEVGEPIFAAGFIRDEVRSASSIASGIPEMLSGFVLKKGRVSIILDKALEEGYQIGYTNDVKKGMSGGPLLNNQGEVVGVNGKHAYPLWEAPDYYQDGSQPCPPLQGLITRSSLAIPIEKGLGLTPNLTSLKLEDETASQEKNSLGILDSDTSNDTSDLIEQMKQEAEATKNCQPSQQKPVINL